MALPNFDASSKAPSRTPIPGTRGWTYEEYCALPEDGHRYEIVKGVLYVAPSPIPAHQRGAFTLGRIVADHVDQHDLGEVFIAPLDVVFAADSVVQPDVLFIRKERAAIVQHANVTGSPDLVAEVLSPSTAAYDRRQKRDLYAAYGVPHLWFLNPQARWLEAYGLGEGGYTLTARHTGNEEFTPSLFPGLVIPLARLWR